MISDYTVVTITVYWTFSIFYTMSNVDELIDNTFDYEINALNDMTVLSLSYNKWK
jgi:hypothetical protein